MARVKLVLLMIIVVVVLIVIFQNTETVLTELVFWRVRMPRAALMLVMAGIGFLGGLYVGSRLLKRHAKKKP